MAFGQRALGMEPRAVSKLVSTSAESNVRDDAKALALAGKALDLLPDSGDMWNVVGEAHFRARHWDEAIKALTKAGELRLDENVTGWYHLAMAFWQKGDEQKCSPDGTTKPPPG